MRVHISFLCILTVSEVLLVNACSTDDDENGGNEEDDVNDDPSAERGELFEYFAFSLSCETKALLALPSLVAFAGDDE